DRLVGLDEKASHQVAAGQILMACDRDELVGSAFERGQAMRHVLHEAGLAASGGPLEEDGKAGLVGGLENSNLVGDRQIEWRVMGVEMLDLGTVGLRTGIEFLQFNGHLLPAAGSTRIARF